jgi:hypothetical protein
MGLCGGGTGNRPALGNRHDSGCDRREYSRVALAASSPDFKKTDVEKRKERGKTKNG